MTNRNATSLLCESILSEAYRLSRRNETTDDWDYTDTESLYHSLLEISSIDQSEFHGLKAVRDALINAAESDGGGLLEALSEGLGVEPEEFPAYLLKQEQEWFSVFQAKEAVSLLAKAAKYLDRKDQDICCQSIADTLQCLDFLGEETVDEIFTSILGESGIVDCKDEGPDEDMNQWYTSNSGIRCPVCKNDTLEGGGSVEVNGGAATQDVSCSSCGSYWDDQYRLTGFSNLHRGEDYKSICQSGNCGLDLTEPFSVVREYTDKDGGPSLHIEGHYDEEKTFTPDVTPTFGEKRFDLLDDSDRCANCKSLV